MTTAAAPLDRRLPAPHSSSQSFGYWGMALLCATEGALFAYLIFSYFYVGLSNRFWPPQGIHDPKLLLPLIMTGLLLTSSITQLWAEKGIERGEPNRLRIGIALTMLLGMGFLVLQGVEYHDKLKEFTPDVHAYASLFYTITSFHGMHVFVGLLMLGYVELQALLGYVNSERHLPVKIVSLYWHFVDAVWLVILTSLYLSPRFFS